MLFHRLADRLRMDGHSVVAHIDAKAESEPFARDDVRFVGRRVLVTWGGYSQVEAMTRLLEDGLASSPEATHLVFLSGQDYPARPLSEFVALLKEDPTRIHMQWHDTSLPTAQFPNIPREWCSLDLYGHFPWNVEPLASKITRRFLPPREMPDGYTPYRGSTFWALPRDAAEYIVSFLRGNGSRRVRWWLKTIRIPDEIAFQTILGNSPLRQRITGWPNNPPRWAPFHYIDWSPAREDPAILDETDLDAVRKRGAFFVRKVEQERSATLLDALDASL